MIKFYGVEQLFEGEWYAPTYNQFTTIEEAREEVNTLSSDGTIERTNFRIVEVVITPVE